MNKAGLIKKVLGLEGYEGQILMIINRAKNSDISKKIGMTQDGVYKKKKTMKWSLFEVIEILKMEQHKYIGKEREIKPLSIEQFVNLVNSRKS